jgi:uncharacterized protein (TIGR02145 family)
MKPQTTVILILVILPYLCAIAQTGDSNSTGTFTDPRNGQVYRTVKIGNLTWMAENLNFQTGNSSCYDNDESNCQKYGRLYDWNTAMSACPAGWRLPTDNDWDDLVQLAGGWVVAGIKLKSAGGWGTCDAGRPCGDGTDIFGFSALPGGYRDSGSFHYAVNFGKWWSATENDTSSAWSRHMYYYISVAHRYYYNKNHGLSVRCVQYRSWPNN